MSCPEYLLSTGIVADIFLGKGNMAKIMHRIAPEKFAVSVITMHEILYCLMAKPAYEERYADGIEDFFADVNVLPVSEDVGAEAARIKLGLKGSFFVLGGFDLLVVATAKCHDLRLVASAGDGAECLKLVHGLKVESWR